MKKKNNIRSIVCIILVIIMGASGIFAISQITPNDSHYNCYYVWEDAAGKSGIADNCYETKQGGLICRNYAYNIKRSVVFYQRICEEIKSNN